MFRDRPGVGGMPEAGSDAESVRLPTLSFMTDTLRLWSQLLLAISGGTCQYHVRTYVRTAY